LHPQRNTVIIRPGAKAVQLDTQTLVVVAIVVLLVPALMGAMVWQTMRTYPGRWVLGNFMAVLSLVLLAARGHVSDWLSIVVANTLAMAAGAAFLQGIRQFRNLRIAWWPECVFCVIGVLGVVYYRYAVNNINARILVISAVLGSIGIANGITLLKGMPQHRRIPYLLTGVAFTFGGTCHFVRGTFQFFYAPVTTLFDRTPANIVFFLLISFVAMSWSLGFILLTGERVAAEAGEPHILRRKFPISSPPSLPDVVAEDEVREQLRKILTSDIFRRSAQMERFLSLVVERSLGGRPDELKEYILGRDVFHRGDDYDPRADSIVRVEAQRLRRKLREYYETQGIADTVLIDLPAGTYVPIFRYLHSGPRPTQKRQSV
jgi:hypothetical protein